MGEKREKLAKEALKKRKPASDDSEGTERVQIPCSGNRSKGAPGKPLAKEVRHVAHGSYKPSLQKLGIEIWEIWVFKKDMRKTSCLMA